MTSIRLAESFRQTNRAAPNPQSPRRVSESLDASTHQRDLSVRIHSSSLGRPTSKRLRENADCDRTVIGQAQNLEEHQGLQTHTG